MSAPEQVWHRIHSVIFNPAFNHMSQQAPSQASSSILLLSVVLALMLVYIQMFCRALELVLDHWVFLPVIPFSAYAHVKLSAHKKFRQWDVIFGPTVSAFLKYSCFHEI